MKIGQYAEAELLFGGLEDVRRCFTRLKKRCNMINKCSKITIIGGRHMSNKVITRMLSLVLCAGMLVTSMPVNASGGRN